MLHTILKLLSLGISKENGKRQRFLERFDAIERNKILVRKNRELILVTRTSLQKRLNTSYLSIMKKINNSLQLTYEYAFENGIVNSYKEHLENVNRLKNNLSSEALSHLDHIINLFETSAKYPVRCSELWAKDIYIYIR